MVRRQADGGDKKRHGDDTRWECSRPDGAGIASGMGAMRIVAFQANPENRRMPLGGARRECVEWAQSANAVFPMRANKTHLEWHSRTIPHTTPTSKRSPAIMVTIAGDKPDSRGRVLDAVEGIVVPAVHEFVGTEFKWQLRLFTYRSTC